MKLSKNFGKTQKETPGDAELISHQLLIKSGLIHQVASGIYSYMPIAWRSLKKIENIETIENSFIKQNYNRKKFTNKKFSGTHKFKNKNYYKSKKIKNNFDFEKFANH